MNAPSKVKADTIAAAYVAAFAEIEAATKDAKGQVGQQKYKYADLSSVIAAIKPALINNGLAFTQPCEPTGEGVTVRTMLHHVSGEALDLGSLFVPANKRDAQGFGSALTYARRYALVSAFGVPTEDDDGNAAVASMSRQEPKQEPKRGLDGPYTSKDALKKAFIALRSEVNRCGDDDTLECLLATDDAKKLIAQCDRDAPHLLHGNDPNAPEWIGLYAEIQRLRDNFQLENVR